MDLRPKNLLHRVLLFREGGYVERCHTVPIQRSYSVGKHTFDMLLLLEQLLPDSSADLRRAVLYHDLAERWMGDIPPMVRLIDPELKANVQRAQTAADQVLGIDVELTDDEAWHLKVLDRLEFFLWCHDEINMGNRHAGPCLDDVTTWIAEHFDRFPPTVKQFVQEFREHGWRRTTERLY